MNRAIFASLLIIAAYLYGTTLYEPWYFTVQRALVSIGLLRLPSDAPEQTRLMGNQLQITVISLCLLIAGVWLFILSDN